MLFNFVYGQAAQLNNFTVNCDEKGMQVSVEFNSPFNGIIYSKNFFEDRNCHFVQEGSNQTDLTFQLPINACGTERVFSEKSSETMENILIIQNDPAFIQEDGDIARLVACRHSFSKIPDLMSRRVIFKPYMIDNLDVISVPFEDDKSSRNVDIWIDITYGVFPNTEPLEGPVKIGDNLTLSIYVKDTANNTDIRVRDCYAYDNIKTAKNGKPAQLQLSEENGCPLRENLLGVWQRTLNTMDTGATMIAFNNLKAFKFPERDNVFLTCNINLCRENCTERCELEPTNPDEEPPMDEMNNGNQSESLGNDYEDLNNVGGFRGSIAANNKRQPTITRGNNQARNIGGNQPSNNRPQQGNQQQGNQQQGNQQQGNQQQGNQQQGNQQRGNQQQGNQQRGNQQRGNQQRGNQQRGNQQQGNQQQGNQQQRNRPQQRQQLSSRNESQKKSSQRINPNKLQQQSQISNFNLRIQHKQNLMHQSINPFEQQNFQKIEQANINNESPPDLIEQLSGSQKKNSIAKNRTEDSKKNKNTRTIGRMRKQEIFGPPQQFSPIQQPKQQIQQQLQSPPQQLNSLQQSEQSQFLSIQQQPQSPPQQLNSLQQSEQSQFLSIQQQPQSPPQQLNSLQQSEQSQFLSIQQQPQSPPQQLNSLQQQNLNNLPLPTNSELREPLSNIQSNDLQASSSGQINITPAVPQKQKPNRLRSRRVVKKKTKSSVQDKNNYSQEGLMPSASESIESTHHQYIPALPVESIYENSNFGTRLSKSI